MWTAAPSRSIVTILHPEDRVRYMGYFQGAMNVGVAIGPIVGSVLYKLVGFTYLFIILGLIHFCYVPIMILFMPENIDSNDQATNRLNNTESNLNIEETPRISMGKLLSNRIVLISTVGVVLACMANTFYEPVLSFRVAEFSDSIFIQSLLFALFV